jgi:hypothetical protein
VSFLKRLPGGIRPQILAATPGMFIQSTNEGDPHLPCRDRPAVISRSSVNELKSPLEGAPVELTREINKKPHLALTHDVCGAAILRQPAVIPERKHRRASSKMHVHQRL